MREVQAGHDNERDKEHDHAAYNSHMPFLLLCCKRGRTLRPEGG